MVVLCKRKLVWHKVENDTCTRIVVQCVWGRGGGKGWVASSPGPSPWEKGLVHTDCACVILYPESGYTVYFCKIFCKLTIYDYVIHLFLLAYNQKRYKASTKHSLGRLAGKGQEGYLQAACLNWRSKRHVVGYSAQTLLWKFYW